MNEELLNLTQRLQVEYNDFHESLFKMRMDSSFTFEEVYGIDVDLKASTVENLESIAVGIAIGIQEYYEDLGNDKRLKHWVDLFIVLCADVIDLIQYGNIAKIPELVLEDGQAVLDDRFVLNDLDSNVKEKTPLELQLMKAEDEVYELDEKFKQLLALLLGLSFQNY